MSAFTGSELGIVSLELLSLMLCRLNRGVNSDSGYKYLHCPPARRLSMTEEERGQLLQARDDIDGMRLPILQICH